VLDARSLSWHTAILSLWIQKRPNNQKFRSVSGSLSQCNILPHVPYAKCGFLGQTLGKVEEITLAYVVLHLWDQRRLVVPITYFLGKPFENWTRRSTELLGTVFLYFDYHLPVNELRAEFSRYVEAHPAWDRRTKSLVISDAKEGSIQIRALVSAADPDKLWTLRCDVREALISYVQEKHPTRLVKTRVAVQTLPVPPTRLTQPAFISGQDDKVA
jgi:small-conductance mechanosensitive channel